MQQTKQAVIDTIPELEAKVVELEETKAELGQVNAQLEGTRGRMAHLEKMHERDTKSRTKSNMQKKQAVVCTCLCLASAHGCACVYFVRLFACTAVCACVLVCGVSVVVVDACHLFVMSIHSSLLVSVSTTFVMAFNLWGQAKAERLQRLNRDLSAKLTKANTEINKLLCVTAAAAAAAVCSSPHAVCVFRHDT